MAVISINYDEGNNNDLGYKSLEISYANLSEKKIFDSGNFIKDWYDLNKFIILKLSGTEYFFSMSSSIDQFFTDGANDLYDIAYLYNNEFISELLYNIDYIDADKYIKFYVHKGTTPTWGELKKMCEE